MENKPSMFKESSKAKNIDSVWEGNRVEFVGR